MRVFILLSIALLALPAAGFAQQMTVQSGALRIQNSGTINLPGDLVVNGALTGATDAAVRFNGAVVQQIAGNGVLSFASLLVNKPSGDVVLAADVAVAALLKLTEGDLDLNGHTVGLGATGVLIESGFGNGAVKGTAGTITATRTLDAPADDNVAGLGATITSAADLGLTQVTRGHAVQTVDGHPSVLRYFDVSPATNTGLDATLVFAYVDAELNGNEEVDLHLFRSTDGGATWTQEGGTGDTAVNTVTLGGIDAFSRWTLAFIPGPVTRYVSTTGTDGTRDCTNPAKPCATITYAVSQANPGDTLDVAAGTYAESGLVLDKVLHVEGQGVIVW